MLSANDAYLKMLEVKDYDTWKRLQQINAAVQRFVTEGKLYIGSVSPMTLKALRRLGYKIKYNSRDKGYHIKWK